LGDANFAVNGNYVFPVELGLGLLSSQSVDGITNYPAINKPSIGERLKRAPWAWGF
jgi:hypothetical protein